MNISTSFNGEEIIIVTSNTVDVPTVSVSEGAVDEGKAPLLNAQGKLDESFLPDLYEELVFSAGEPITSGSLVAVVNDRAYKADCFNIDHMFAIRGIALNGVDTFEDLLISSEEDVFIAGWGLPAANTKLFCGPSGQLVTMVPNGAAFSALVAVVQTVEKLFFQPQSYTKL